MEETDNKNIPDKASFISMLKDRKWEFISLAGIIALAAVLIFMQRFMETEQGRDSTYYLFLAEKWQCDGFYGVVDHLSGNFWFPPLHLFLIALLSHTGIATETAAMIIGMGCGILMPLISFAIANELFHDKRISLSAALLTAVHPSIIDMSVQAQRDVPYLFAAGWCIYLIIAAIRRDKWYWWSLAGIPFAVSFLIRYETAEFLPLLGIYFLVSLFKKQQKWYVVFRNLVIFAFSGAAMIIILLFFSGTLNYMGGAYYRYFMSQAKYLHTLYDGEAQQ